MLAERAVPERDQSRGFPWSILGREARSRRDLWLLRSVPPRVRDVAEDSAKRGGRHMIIGIATMFALAYGLGILVGWQTESIVLGLLTTLGVVSVCMRILLRR